MLRLEDVTFAHPRSPEYRFSMLAEAGKVTAITGASGSGKSTLLDLIAGFATPSSGRIELDGRDLLPLQPEQRPISILFQTELLFDHLTAQSNVALGLPRGVADPQTRVAAALFEVGIAQVGPQRAATLSGGEKQRVALARTLLRARPVLLLDEPFSALDEATRISVRELVVTLTTRHGWRTIMVSHDREDMAAMANRLYRLENGRLLPG